MNSKEFKERIERIEKDLEELKKRPMITGEYEFKDGETYFFVSRSGEIVKDSERYWNVDKWSEVTGNKFRTREEAEDYKRYLEIRAKVKEISRRFDPVDWKDDNVLKHSIGLFCGDINQNSVNFTRGAGKIYCSSSEFLGICLDEIGKEDLEFYCKYEV